MTPLERRIAAQHVKRAASIERQREAFRERERQKAADKERRDKKLRRLLQFRIRRAAERRAFIEQWLIDNADNPNPTLTLDDVMRLQPCRKIDVARRKMPHWAQGGIACTEEQARAAGIDDNDISWLKYRLGCERRAAAERDWTRKLIADAPIDTL